MPDADYFNELLPLFPCDPRCPEDFRLGFQAVIAGLSPSSSLTSRRFSIWPKVRCHLDKAFKRAVESCQSDWSRELLACDRLSEMAKVPPAIRPEPRMAAGENGYADLRAEQLEAELTIKPANMPEIEWQLMNLECWDANLRFAIRSLLDSSGRPSVDGESLCGVLESVRELFRLFRHFRPKATKALLDLDTLADARTRPQTMAYCELCWRESMRSIRLREIDEQEAREIKMTFTNCGLDCADRISLTSFLHRLKYGLQLTGVDAEISRQDQAKISRILGRFDIERIRAGNLSRRYCSIHKPGSAKYHADLRYKAAFHHHLEVLKGWANSEFALNLPLPASADVQERRKVAYEQVHSRLHAIAPKASPAMGLREKVWQMRQEGLSQSEMARRLGVSRQAISKAKKSLEVLVKNHQVGSYLNPLTGEAQIPDSTRALIIESVDKGFSVAETARAVGLSKATVDGLVRLVMNKPQISS